MTYARFSLKNQVSPSHPQAKMTQLR